MPSYLGALSVGNIYRGFTVGCCFLFECMKMSGAKDVSSALNRWSSESFGSRNYTAWFAHK